MPPPRLLLRFFSGLAVVLLAEALVMLLLPRLPAASDTPAWPLALADAALLTLLVAGPMWWLLLQPWKRLTEKEAALRQTMALTTRILAAIPSPVAYLDREFRFVWVNPAYARADDREPDFFLGKNHFELYPNPENEAIFRKVVETAQPFEARAKPFVYAGHPERGVTYWDVRLEPIADATGRVEHLLLTLTDVTAHQHLETALRESQENARALLDAIAETALLITAEGVILTINRTGARRFGRLPEEMVGHALSEFMPPELSAARMARLQMAVETGLPLEFEDSRAGRQYRIALNPVHDPDGRVRRVAAYAQDITEARRHEAMERLLREADEQILQGFAPEAILTFLCDQVARHFDLALAWFARREKDGSVTLLAGAGPAVGFFEAMRRTGLRWDDAVNGHSATAWAIRLGRPQVVRADTAQFVPCREAAENHGIAAACSLPLVLRGEVWGALTVFSRRADTFDDVNLLHVLENIVARVAVTLEASFEHEQLRLLSAALTATANAVFITDVDGHILWVNDAFSRLCGYAPSELIGKTPRVLKSGVHNAAYYDALWSTITAGRPWVSQTTDRHKDGHLYTVRQTITPLKNAEGRVTHFIAVHEDISEAVAREARMAQMAHFDALTGLPNRNLFFDRLGQALAASRRTGDKLALLFLDLDRFKPVNDTWGHAVGDALLKWVAQRLTTCVRESDTVARMAGDEFTVILTHLGGPEDARPVAEKIIRALNEPFLVDGHTIEIGVSIGIALYPDDGSDAETLLRHADDAMYAAKAAGRNTYRF